MRIRALITAVAMFGLGDAALPGTTETVVPSGLWHLKVCFQVSYTRPHCAYLDETHKLRVRDGSADEDKALFDATISADLTQQVLDDAVAVIRSFAPPRRASRTDANNLTVQIVVNGTLQRFTCQNSQRLIRPVQVGKTL
jgi:hypothetical protein